MAPRWFFLAGLAVLGAAAVHGEEFKVGTAKVDITPPTGFALWGYAARRDAPSTGVRDPLQARAVVLAVGKEQVAVVSLDLGRPPTRQSFQAIQKRVKDGGGIDYLFLVASHTHHGPVIELDHWPTKDKSYVRALENKIASAILQAQQNLQPARLGIASASVELNRNRHSKRADKPADRELVVIRLEDAAGKTLAHLVNFAAHPTMLPATLHEFSPDFPGFLAEHVEKKAGGVCLFLQGAAGDLSPKPAKPGAPAAFGAELGAKVLELSQKLEGKLATPKNLKIRDRSFTFGKRFDLSNPLVHAAFSLVFFKGLVDFYEREYREGIRPRMTTALLDGRIGIVGVSGEFFSGHALALKKRARLEHLLFLGYCNDYHQYFPTIEAIAEGGYGADSMVSPVEIGAGERMMDQALIDLYEMRGKIRKNELGK